MLQRIGATSGQVASAYALSPMQEGLLFHTLSESGSGEYHVQVQFSVRGKLDVSAFERTWNALMLRHDTLRTAFVWEGVAKPLQVVLKSVTLPIAIESLQHESHDAQRARIDALVASDKRLGFELSAAPLMRVSLIQTAADDALVLWSFHHLLLDGWSVHALLHEFEQLYDDTVAGRITSLEPVRPFSTYIAEVSRTDAESEPFWRAKLAGFSAPTSLGLGRPRHAETLSGYGQLELRLSAALSQSLQHFARRRGLTANTVFQGAWALLLSRYSGDRDVVFGATVTTRPPSVEGIERMVGLFLNTLPVRVTLDDAVKTRTWLSTLQLEQAEARMHESTALADIQRWSELTRGTALFDSLLVFENYPGATPFSPRRASGCVWRRRNRGTHALRSDIDRCTRR